MLNYSLTSIFFVFLKHSLVMFKLRNLPKPESHDRELYISKARSDLIRCLVILAGESAISKGFE